MNPIQQLPWFSEFHHELITKAQQRYLSTPPNGAAERQALIVSHFLCALASPLADANAAHSACSSLESSLGTYLRVDGDASFESYRLVALHLEMNNYPGAERAWTAHKVGNALKGKS